MAGCSGDRGVAERRPRPPRGSRPRGAARGPSGCRASAASREPALGGEHRPRGRRRAPSSRPRRRPRRRAGRGNPHQSAEPTRRGRHLPVRQPLAQCRRERVTLLPQAGPVQVQLVLGVVQQVRQRELLDHRRPQVDGQAGPPNASTSAASTRAQPSRRPPQKLLHAPPTVIACRPRPRHAGPGAWHPAPVEGERPACTSSTTATRAGASQGAGDPGALGVAHQRAGGVVEVGHQVGGAGPGRRTVDSSRSRSQPPASTGIGTSRAPAPLNACARVGIAGHLHHHPVAGSHQHPRARWPPAASAPTVTKTCSGSVGSPRRRIALGQSLLKRRQPGGVVAVAGQIGRQPPRPPGRRRRPRAAPRTPRS